MTGEDNIDARHARGQLAIDVEAIVREQNDQLRPVFASFLDIGAHVGTFRGFLPAMAAGVAAIEFMESHGIVAHVANVGARLKAGLAAVAAKRSFLGECRGLGFMLGVEVLAGDGTKTPSYEKAKRVRAECLRRGLIVELAGRHDGVVRFIPPLVFTADHADAAIRIFDEATAAVEAA